jgi:hypothetical protein
MNENASKYVRVYLERLFLEITGDNLNFDGSLVEKEINVAINNMSENEWAYFKEETTSWQLFNGIVESDAAQELTLHTPALLIFMMHVCPDWVVRQFNKQLERMDHGI